MRKRKNYQKRKGEKSHLILRFDSEKFVVNFIKKQKNFKTHRLS